MPRPPPPPRAETKQGAPRPRSRPHPSPSPDRVRARPALPQGPAAPFLRHASRGRVGHDHARGRGSSILTKHANAPTMPGGRSVLTRGEGHDVEASEAARRTVALVRAVALARADRPSSRGACPERARDRRLAAI